MTYGEFLENGYFASTKMSSGIPQPSNYIICVLSMSTSVIFGNALCEQRESQLIEYFVSQIQSMFLFYPEYG